MTTLTSSRFAATFKRLRLEKHWKQEDLANALHVTLRAIVSWETGARIPAPGMVVVLCMLFTDDREATADVLSHELLIAYLLDDMERQTRVHHEEAFHTLVKQGRQNLLHISEERQQSEQAHETAPFSFEQAMNGNSQVAEARPPDSWRAASPQQEIATDTLQQLFVLFDQLRQHPELITVVYDFLREVAPEV